MEICSEFVVNLIETNKDDLSNLPRIYLSLKQAELSQKILQVRNKIFEQFQKEGMCPLGKLPQYQIFDQEGKKQMI